ncbi:MAG: hypothetical protein PHQ35_10665 [Phycisphaerae bacterium]|nr:hypothetical protein [Phycisphaerae bacterium]
MKKGKFRITIEHINPTQDPKRPLKEKIYTQVVYQLDLKKVIEAVESADLDDDEKV